MKKTILALGLAGAMLIPTRQAQAIIGFGLHLGRDGYSVAEETYDHLFGISGIDLVREEMSNPIGIGAYLYIDAIPIVDLEAGFDLYGNTYKFSFENPVTDQSLEEQVAWARTAGWLSVQRNLFKLPTLKFYLGGGLNFNAAAPLANKENVVEFLGSSAISLDPEELIDFLKDKIETKTGFHAELGLRIKPPLIPLSVHVRYRKTFVEGVVPGESSFSTIMIGGGIQF